ncbi:receptor-type tyrosine-protein phosphatase N2-like, partial [Tropilaelaps mercedesae]
SDKVAAQLSNVAPADQASIRFTPNLPADDGSSRGARIRPNSEAAGTFADEVFVPRMASATPSVEGHDPERELRRLEALTSASTNAGEGSTSRSDSTSHSNNGVGDSASLPTATRKGEHAASNLLSRDDDDQRIKHGNTAENVGQDVSEQREDNRFAQDIQDNLWRGRSRLDDAVLRQQMLNDQTFDGFEDDTDVEEDLPHPVTKRNEKEDWIIWREQLGDQETSEDKLRQIFDMIQQDPAFEYDRIEKKESRQLGQSNMEQWSSKESEEDDFSPLEDLEPVPTASTVDQDVQESLEPTDSETPLDMFMETAPDKSDFVGDLRIRADPFYRPMRLDTKKQGPGYFFHEREDGENEQEYAKNMLLLQRKMHMLAGKDFIDGSDLMEALNDIDQNGQKREAEVAGVPPSRVPERHAAGVAPLDPYHTDRGVEAIDSNTAYLVVRNIHTGEVSHGDARALATTLEKIFGLPTGTISQLRLNGNQIGFKLLPNEKGLNASEMIRLIDDKNGDILRATNVSISSAGIGESVKYELISPRSGDLFLFTFVVCGSVVGVLLAISVIYIVRRHQLSRDKLHGLNGEDDPLAKFDYQDLCRQRMADSGTGKEGALAAAMEAGRAPEKGSPKKVKIASQQSHDSSRSSSSSWSEEPVASNMDISTGHMILSYMEDHLKSKNRLDEEWEGLCAYETDPCSTSIAEKQENAKKNRYTFALPYDHARVILSESSNAGDSDYINASAITDHDPRNPAYIATQGPLAHTASDFWQMVWEQGSVVIVTLTRLMENGVAMCHRYWPEEGSEVYSLYEVHLVSEHIWCDDYLVRSFYLKNLNTSETRTVTQFHFLSWPEAGVPPSAKALLDFRRKVNKSYRGRSCPIVVHCSDGSGRTGTYILADMVLNRIAKGAKEINVAATLEHVRDQRANMVRTKSQFEFVLMAIAEEVHAILKALSKE